MRRELRILMTMALVGGGCSGNPGTAEPEVERTAPHSDRAQSVNPAPVTPPMAPGSSPMPRADAQPDTKDTAMPPGPVNPKTPPEASP